jgi:hypothetical protein
MDLLFCYQTMVLEGGLVPKGLYMTEGDLEREGCPLTEDSIYHSVSLGRGQVSLYNIVYFNYKVDVSVSLCTYRMVSLIINSQSLVSY